jgi:hypothetical protein
MIVIGRPFVIEFRQPSRVLYQPEEFVAVQHVRLGNFFAFYILKICLGN